MPDQKLVAACAVAIALASAAPFAQSKAPVLPRTPDGHPDLQGIWSYITAVPLEKPGGSGAYIYAKEDAANPVGGYNSLFFDTVNRSAKDRPTSQIVDPPDGHLPPLTPGAQKRLAEYGKKMMRPPEGPEDRALYERCIIGFGSTSGPPMMPVLYNNNYEIVQTADAVMILVEMVHDIRVIRINGTHKPANIRQLLGDSVGHWDGDTLVVDTTNFTDKTNFRGSGERLHLVERFTRADANTLRYEFTVDDPKMYSKPWTNSRPMTPLKIIPGLPPLIEYNCDENNRDVKHLISKKPALEPAPAQGARPGGRGPQ